MTKKRPSPSLLFANKNRTGMIACPISCKNELTLDRTHHHAALEELLAEVV